MFRKFLMLTVATGIGVAPICSYADWALKTSDNAFDGPKHVLLIGTLEGDRAIMYECEGGKLSVSYLENDSKTEIVDGAPVGEMAIKVDKNDPVIFYGVRAYRQNADYLAIRSHYEETIKKSLALLKNAKDKINVGIKFDNGTTYSMSGDVYHSTPMAMGFASECGFSL